MSAPSSPSYRHDHDFLQLYITQDSRKICFLILMLFLLLFWQKCFYITCSSLIPIINTSDSWTSIYCGIIGKDEGHTIWKN
jgi:hypothetical protein